MTARSHGSAAWSARSRGSLSIPVTPTMQPEAVYPPSGVGSSYGAGTDFGSAATAGMSADDAAGAVGRTPSSLLFGGGSAGDDRQGVGPPNAATQGLLGSPRSADSARSNASTGSGLLATHFGAARNPTATAAATLLDGGSGGGGVSAIAFQQSPKNTALPAAPTVAPAALPRSPSGAVVGGVAGATATKAPVAGRGADVPAVVGGGSSPPALAFPPSWAGGGPPGAPSPVGAAAATLRSTPSINGGAAGVTAAAAPTGSHPAGGSPLHQSAPPAAPPPPQWKRTLYERQPFEDNYVDPQQFMAMLRTNTNVRQYRVGQIIRDTLAVVQQLSIVVIFCVVFAHVHAETLTLQQMVFLDVATLVIAAVMTIGVEGTVDDPEEAGPRLHSGPGRRSAGAAPTVPSSSPSRASSQPRSSTTGAAAGSSSAASSGQLFHGLSTAARAGSAVSPTRLLVSCLSQGAVFAMYLLLLSPIFRTMTISYATDTIWAMSISFFFVHVVFCDYNYINGHGDGPFQQSVAGNAALFATVLMASRIRSPLYAAALIGFGTMCFTLSPMVRHNLRKASPEAYVAVTFTLFGIAIGCLINIVPLLAICFTLANLLIVLVIPLSFVKLQARFKYQISGPWDEAKPRNSSAAAEWANAGLLS